MVEAVDPNLVQDFLTESGELVEQLDADLVRLESEADPKALLDQIFRALHTIKGAASFLNMPEVTSFAHAAEDALNRLRKGEVGVNAQVIDALLKSVDVIKRMLAQVGAGDAVSPGPADLVLILHDIAEGRLGGASVEGAGADSAGGETGAGGVDVSELGASRPLALSSEKADLLEGMIIECRGAAESCAVIAGLLSKGDASGSAKLEELLSGLSPTVEYFEFEGLRLLCAALRRAGVGASHVVAGGALFGDFAKGLSAGVELEWTAQDIEESMSRAFAVSAVAAAPVETAKAAAVAGAKAESKGEARGEGKTGEGAGETTVRVEVNRLEALLNLVGEMVLTKNQILGMARQLRGLSLPHEVQESINSVTSHLDRLTSELQVGVMRTRMQPLSKLFGRYPRVIRDLARLTSKQIEIEVRGGETEVDKSVLEALADPMVHILRNSADHGIEGPDARRAAGKDPTGTIRVSAEHRGGHVRVEIADDGKGIDPDVIGRKAVEKGVVTAEQVASMSSQEIVNLIFAAGFSTAEQVSDLSGRGVGMDVVRTNIQKIGGSVNVSSVKGKGTQIEVLIPLTVAILPAMLVGVGANQYAVPVASIVEIVRLEDTRRHTVAGKAVMRLREQVLPLVDMPSRLGDQSRDDGRRFAVVVEVGQQRVGLVVDELIGQQEVVIKPLDDAYTTGGPFSGATIREDGDVSLIIDAGALVRDLQGETKAA